MGRSRNAELPRERVRNQIIDRAENAAPKNIGDIKWALGDLKKRRDRYKPMRDYYNGDHKLMISADRLRNVFAGLFKDYRVNYCGAVVDALVDRLQVAGFTSPLEDQIAQDLERQRREAETRRQAAQSQNAIASAQPQDVPADLASADGADAGAGSAPTPPASAEAQQVQSEISALEQKIGEVPSISKAASEIWKHNRMQRRAGHVHQEAVAAADAFILVWPNPQNDPILHLQYGHEMAVAYEANTPGKVSKAGKIWSEKIKVNQTVERLETDDSRATGSRPTRVVASNTAQREVDGWRLTLYYPDRVEKYAAVARTGKSGKGKDWPKASDFFAYQPEDDRGVREPWPVVNKWNETPVFHFANKADIGEYGQSELKNAVPIQDAMNWQMFQLLVGVEFQAFKQRYLIGVEDPTDDNDSDGVVWQPGGSGNLAADRMRGARGYIRTGPDKYLAFSGGPKDEEHPPSVGEFSSADLNQISGVLSLTARQMAVVTGTPVSYFQLVGTDTATPASGESQKVSDIKLNSKVEDRSIAFGDTWAACMSLAVRMRDGGDPKETELETTWKDTRPRNEKEIVDIANTKISAGLPWQMAFEELGYSPEQIERMEHLKMRNSSMFQTPIAGGFGPGGKDINQIADELLDQAGLDR